MKILLKKLNYKLKIQLNQYFQKVKTTIRIIILFNTCESEFLEQQIKFFI